ncbi:DUF4097 family beta strand repeat-containing protein [Convivina praedatoris]|uniref:DUF4097 domain-containing protein n=1 Tax=Convivina praedatoris TaxID=2880963 RepID=A0ABM9D1K6_9LACO|nr:DUF4097 family beta strand repeat-containing protein [Convivina sp. LMG 32447]CAH1851771.1 hypothetical protein R077815_00397 [Convivina sp. LMG 32447]CAH1853854.1 hypothetical protein LMG032447_00729 [Convivina sp. LMG 32447]CAH1854230.1 hypothetical protein R078138_00833 [Convivina sp. LMG 32447]
MKKVVIAGLATSLIGIIMATTAFCVARPGNIAWEDGKFVYSQNHKKKLTTISLPTEVSTDQIKNIELSVANTDVVIKHGSTFKIESNDSQLKTPLIFDQNSGTLSLQSQSTKNSNLKINITGFYDNSPQIVITIPDGFNDKNLSISSTSGDIRLSESQLAVVTLKSQEGDIMLLGNSMKTANVSNNDGDVIIKSEITDGGKISNDNGDIHVSSSKLPPYSVKTVNGDFMSSKNQIDNNDNATLFINNNNGDISMS